MKIKIKRTRDCNDNPSGIMFSEFEGVLYEYQDFQFCIGCDNGTWRAIELQTGYQVCCYESEVNDSIDYCIDLLVRGIESKSPDQYTKGIQRAKMALQYKGIELPINKRNIADENNNKNP